MTDRFATQARINRDALSARTDTLFANVNIGATGFDITGTLPPDLGQGIGCHRCHALARYRAYENGFVNPTEIGSNPILAELATRYGHPGLQTMLAAILHADASGAGVAATLRAQSVQRTEERFARAERLAMESPVKMLAPLVLCIFPCAFLVIGFPIAQRLLQWT